MNFYNYFLLLCANKGIKPSPAGEKIGVSRTAVSGWKNGRLPTDSTLQAISEFFNVPMSEFWKCDDIAESRGIDPETRFPGFVDSEDDEMIRLRDAILNRPELRMLFKAAEDAPTSEILSATAQILRYKEQSK